MDINFIKEAIEPDVEKLGCKVWGLELFGRHSNQTLRVYIDKEKGISLEDCEVVSKHISKVLDVETISQKNIAWRSHLLVWREDFFITINIKILSGQHKITFLMKRKKNKKGLLKEVSEDGIELVTDNLERLFVFLLLSRQIL